MAGFPAYRLFVKDVKAQRSRSKLEFVWNIVDPLVMSIAFIVLYAFRAISVDVIGIPYAFFVISGVLFWQSITEAMTGPLSLINKHRKLLENTNVSPEIIWLSSLFNHWYMSFFRLLIIIVVAIYFGIGDFASITLFALLFLFSIAVFHSIGLFLSPLNQIAQGVERVVKIILKPLIFLSGVIFPLPEIAEIKVFLNINVFAAFIEFGRKLIQSDVPIFVSFHWLVLSSTVIVGVFGIYFFHVNARFSVDKS